MMTKNTIPSSCVVTLTICGILSACSPYVFSDQVGVFSVKSTEAVSAYRETNTRILDDKRQFERAKWLNGRPELKRTAGCLPGNKNSPPCDIEAVRTGPQRLPHPPVAQTPVHTADTRGEDVCRQRTTPASSEAKRHPPTLDTATQADPLKALATYAASLASITKAQDRADFDSAAAKSSAAVEGLAQAASVATGAGPAVGPLAKASSNALLWLVGQGLDYQRLQQLRMATESACVPVHDLAGAMGVLLENQQEERLRTLADLLVERIHTANVSGRVRKATDQAYGAAIDSAFVTVDAYRAVADAKPEMVSKAFRNAHDDLVQAVRENDGELSALTKSLQTFIERVDELTDAARAAGSTTSVAKKN